MLEVKKLSIHYWHLTKLEKLPYEQGQDLPVESFHDVVDEVLASGYNVMVLRTPKEHEFILMVDDGRFRQS